MSKTNKVNYISCCVEKYQRLSLRNMFNILITSMFFGFFLSLIFYAYDKYIKMEFTHTYDILNAWGIFWLIIFVGMIVMYLFS